MFHLRPSSDTDVPSVVSLFHKELRAARAARSPSALSAPNPAVDRDFIAQQRNGGRAHHFLVLERPLTRL